MSTGSERVLSGRRRNRRSDLEDDLSCGERAAPPHSLKLPLIPVFARVDGLHDQGGNGARGGGEPSGRGLAGTGPGAVTEQSGAADMNLA